MESQQQGAVLVVVMALLASALMIGVVSMQSALVDERLASNYRAATLAQMRAEIAVSQAITRFNGLEWDDPPLVSNERSIHWEDYASHSATTILDSGCPQKSCLFIPVEREGQAWVMALGAVIQMNENGAEALLAQSLPIFIRLEDIETNTGVTTSATNATVIWH